jgi:hypothetical protein
MTVSDDAIDILASYYYEQVMICLDVCIFKKTNKLTLLLERQSHAFLWGRERASGRRGGCHVDLDDVSSLATRRRSNICHAYQWMDVYDDAIDILASYNEQVMICLDICIFEIDWRS